MLNHFCSPKHIYDVNIGIYEKKIMRHVEEKRWLKLILLATLYIEQALCKNVVCTKSLSHTILTYNYLKISVANLCFFVSLSSFHY